MADVPDFAWKEYHEDQVRVYSKLTEFAFKALKMPLIQEWLESFAEKLDIQNVEIRLNRLPHHEAKLLPVEWRRALGRLSFLVKRDGKIKLNASSTV